MLLLCGGEKSGGPGQAASAQPGGGEAVAAMFGEQFGDARLICLRRGGGKGERHIAKPQVEQPIATSRLAVIIALGGGSTEDFALTVVQPEQIGRASWRGRVGQYV